MEKDLFGDNSTQKTSGNKSLVIQAAQKKPLNKQQQDFNRLVKKIESLREKAKKIAATLDDKMAFYTKYLHPMEVEKSRLAKENVKQLYYCLGNIKLINKQDKEVLKEVIAGMIDTLLPADMDDDEMKEIFEEVNNMSFEDAREDDFEEMRSGLEQMFKSQGFDIDLSAMHKDMSEEDIARTLKQLQEDFKEQTESQPQQKNGRKPTAKQLQKEAQERLIEEARSKNISTLYKQLAKLFHPDLEQDETKKGEKEILMKQLTMAYENKDMHTLLRLEMEWINKEEADLNKLTDEKLKVYNAALKEQVQELEQEIFMIKSHPRYQPLQAYLSPFDNDLTRISLPQAHIQTRMEVEQRKKSLSNLGGPNALKELKRIIKEYKEVFKLRNVFANNFSMDDEDDHFYF